jgi:hypothetical protein
LQHHMFIVIISCLSFKAVSRQTKFNAIFFVKPKALGAALFLLHCTVHKVNDISFKIKKKSLLLRYHPPLYSKQRTPPRIEGHFGRGSILLPVFVLHFVSVLLPVLRLTLVHLQ